MRFRVLTDISQLREQAFADLNEQVSKARSLFITVTPGQEAVYAQKVREAHLIVGDPGQGDNIAEGETPLITAEALDDNVSRFEKAVEILTLDQHWSNASALIERTRRQAKASIVSANSAFDLRAALAIDWTQVREFSAK